ncbi:MAG: sigma-70 family RNA polymerase sigma factor [Actinophytocola sp.]|uniref:RNA polymerase sigma factor ShbA n=1 Tax=Actinophytocola sp. TaxID=1872138 RepID=UPI001323E26D|nr:RNA polymerase sigma factor ShbA [Actinophytocola sp.]MPZ86054.1 sigma-70 family RNA polymerase sigma factor [Actinophytocola sp.]
MTVVTHDNELARRARRGDPEAAADLLTRIRPGVLRYCWAHLGSLGRGDQTPDDVAQDVCLAVFEALPRYQDRGLPFTAFVYRVAAHKVADAHRGASAATTRPIETVPEPIDDGWSPERHAVTADLSRRLLPLLDDLTAAQREIIVLRVAAGLSAEEVGAVIGKSPAAVRMTQSRALARLREWARQHAPDEVVA